MATIEECVKPVLEKADEETLKEMFVISKLGRKYFEEQDDRSKDRHKDTYPTDTTTPDISREMLIKEIIGNMNDAITEGMGVADIFKDMDKYPKQLQTCIDVLIDASKQKAEELGDEEWKQSLREIKDKNKNIELSCEQACKLEEDIVGLLLDAYIRTAPPEEREAIIKQIEKGLKEYTKDMEMDIPAGKLSYVLMHGGLIALRQILGFNFHTLLAIVINAIWRYTGAVITGAGMSLAVNAVIQRMVSIVLGPLGWIIVILTTIPLVTKLLNPRNYDRYIPLVVYIYLLRHDIQETLKELPE